MKAPVSGWFAGIVLLATVALSASAEEGYVPLLDATHTTGWKHIGEGDVTIDHGVATTSTPGHAKDGGWLYYGRKQFGDFSLRVEFQVDAPGTNSGVFARLGDPALGEKATDAGYEVDIFGGKTGTILALPERIRPTRSVDLKPKTWHELEVAAIGQHYVVRLDGATINDFSGKHGLSGYVALQNYPGSGEARFRNVRIKELSAPATVASTVPDATVPAARPALDELAKQAPNATEWALAPLDREVPGDIRQNLTFLREDLLDEEKKAGKAWAGAYEQGAALCAGLLAVLEERRQAQTHANFRAVEAEARTGVTNQALEARRNYKMSWPQFEREKAQRAELKREATDKADILKEKPKLDWVERTAVLRRSLDALYAKFRAAVRQAG